MSLIESRDNKPAVERIEDDIRQDIIASFREWLDKPETKIEGVERFWEYKVRLLLVEIDRLVARVEELECENKDYARIIEERGVQITKLCDNLTALVEAAEKVLWSTHADNLCNLNAVVQKIKEGE